LQSETDKGISRSRFVYLYDVFFDVFNAATGEKVLTIQGAYSGPGDDPEACLGKTAWLAERYFIVPLGPHRERCLVCEFGGRKHEQGAKP
jgi:hypothetical protein